MSITVTCQCGKRLCVSDKYAGRKGRCPHCSSVLEIPAATAAPDETAPAAVDMDAGPTRSAGAGGKARWIAAAFVVAVVGIAVYRYSTAGKSAKPDAQSSPIATARSAEEAPPASTEEPAADTTGNDPAPSAPDKTADPQASPSSGKAGRPAAPPARGRSSSILLQGFVPVLDESLAAYRDHELSGAEEDLVGSLLSDEELVGGGGVIESSYPPPAMGLLDWGAMKRLSQAEGATATLNVYVEGKGLTLEMLKARFGPPRLEKGTAGGLCVTYGNACVLFGKGNEFLGVVAVLFPDKKPAVDNEPPPETVAIGKPAVEPAPEKEAASPVAQAPEPKQASDWGPEYPLEYQFILGSEDPLVGMMGRRYLSIVGKPGSPNYRAILGGRQVAVTFEPGSSASVRVDTNGDNSTADEKPFRGAPTRGRGARVVGYRFGPITFAPANAADAEPVQFFIETNSMYPIIYPARCRVGDVRFGGETCRVALIDCDLDGRYDNACKLPAPAPTSGWYRSDGIAIDANRNKRFDPGGADQWEIGPLTKRVRFRDRDYLVRVAPDGSAIQYQPATPAMGTLDIGRAGAELLVLGEAGVFRLAGRNQWNLPEGRYSCWSVVLHQAGAGAGWELPSSGSTGKLANFEIRGRTLTQIPVGSPLIARTSVSESKPSSGQTKVVSIGVSVVDSSGVEYAVAAERGNQKLAAPSLRILASNGTPLQIGKFAYG